MQKEQPLPVETPKPSPQPTAFFSDTTIKSAWVDTFSVAVRDDGIALIRGFASLPEGQLEQVRFLATRKNMESLVDILCDLMQYTPKPPAGQQEGAPRKKG